MFDDGRFSLSESGSVTAQGSYEIDGVATSALTGETGPLLRLSVRPNLLFETDFVVRIREDTLTLKSLVDDDFDHVFVRLDGP